MEGPRRIALLGGGQLGRMFIENALRYNAVVDVLDPDPECPCAKLADRYVQGAFNDRDTVLRFAREAGVVGIEIEHVSVEALEELERQGKVVIPSSSTLRTIQDKGLQKEFYVRHGIPTAPFALVENAAGIGEHHALMPAFLKTRTGGYDGKGVMPVDSDTAVPASFQGPYMLEKRVPIAKELAVIAVLGADGNCAAYDPVEMVFDPRLNLVDTLLAPARCGPAIGQRAKELAMQVANAFGDPGIYAVEMFLTPDQELLVNETAPRAHNSGHFTIEACASSQYDQLLRAYMGWPIGDVRMHGPAAMVNLVGTEGSGIPVLAGTDRMLRESGTFIHLYGKHRTRTGRKMGHVTIVADDAEAVDRAVAVVKAHGKVVPRGSRKQEEKQP
jgi:5-(carboxyamino)imidazole ribonucleotide synthase